MVDGAQEVDPFDHAVLRVVVMPTDDVILICIRLLGDGVINDDAIISAFDSSHVRLDDVPQVVGGELALLEEALDAAMTDATTQQSRHPVPVAWLNELIR